MTAEAVPETPRSVLTLAAATVVLHLASNLGLFGWEYFRDELYYLVCARHPALGYVDHPPLSIWILSVVALFDHGIFAIRLVPALAAGATVWLTGRMASDLGARRGATTLAALAAACAPILRAICGFYSMNALEVLTWTLLAFLLVRNLRDPSPRRWILIGATLGLGILNKHTTGMFGVVLVIGLFLSPSRNVLRSPGVWLGAALAAALTIPNLAWQAAHGFPSLEFYRNADLYKNVPTPPHAVVIEQIVTLHPLTFPLWAAGLAWCLFAPAARRFRSLGWTFLLLLVLLVASGSSRPDRIAGAYPMMFAAGAAALSGVRLGRVARRAAGWGYGAILAASALALLPICLPVLPPMTTAAWTKTLHLQMEMERGKVLELPQLLADRLGWQKLVEDLDRVVAALPASQRGHAAIAASNYGEASAVNILGARRGMPPAISGHNSYWLWGPGRDDSVSTWVAIGDSREDLQVFFAEVQPAGSFECGLCVEDGAPIWIARAPLLPLREAWGAAKHFE